MLNLKRNLYQLLALAGTATVLGAAAPKEPCRIEVVDRENGWPVPMVELRTTHSVRFISDNAGVIAFDLPELMGKETWFDVIGHGYEIPADGFGYKGVRLTPAPGKTFRVTVNRSILAKRIGRLTGAGIFAESQKLGREVDWPETGVLGCDSVQNAVHDGKLFWAWGDTTIARYPLGIFHASSATTKVQPLESFQPPLRLRYNYFTDAKGAPRAVANMPGDGPTWLSGYVSLPDKTGAVHLVCSYIKVNPPLEGYLYGLAAWDNKAGKFESLRVIWSKASSPTKDRPRVPEGHPAIWRDDAGKEWVYFGNPLPTLRCPATFEAWQDPGTWETLETQETLASATDRRKVKPHSGSIAWNPYRKRWVTVFMEAFGEPSVFGELWYAEAKKPTGPWGKTIKILTHENYTFYNPRLHPEWTAADSPMLFFEGTFTREFADKPAPTPRYDYNQILYRLDLDDPGLSPTHEE